MTSEEWGILFPWGAVSVQDGEIQARRLYWALKDTGVVRTDGSLQILDDLKLVRRFVPEWKVVPVE